MGEPRESETDHVTPWSHLYGVLLVLLVSAAFAAALAVPAPDANTTSLLGVLVAAIGLVVALVAAVYSRRAADSASESLSMARKEHAAFMEQLEARADFAVYLSARDADRGVVVGRSFPMRVVVVIGIKNIGRRAAREVTVNLVIPQGYDGLQWELEPFGSARDTDEQLHGPTWDVEGPRGQYISKQLPYVGTRSHYEVLAGFNVFGPPGKQTVIPIRCRVESDDLAEAAPEPTVDASVTAVYEPRD